MELCELTRWLLNRIFLMWSVFLVIHWWRFGMRHFWTGYRPVLGSWTGTQRLHLSHNFPWTRTIWLEQQTLYVVPLRCFSSSGLHCFHLVRQRAHLPWTNTKPSLPLPSILKSQFRGLRPLVIHDGFSAQVLRLPLLIALTSPGARPGSFPLARYRRSFQANAGDYLTVDDITHGTGKCWVVCIGLSDTMSVMLS